METISESHLNPYEEIKALDKVIISKYRRQDKYVTSVFLVLFKTHLCKNNDNDIDY